MKHLHISAILAAGLMLIGTIAASAQTPISSYYFWGAGNATLPNAYPPNGTTVEGSNGYVNHMSSGERTPNWGKQVNVNGNNYPTYANVLTSSDAFKIKVSAGSGLIKVYYREGDLVTNRNNVSMSLDINSGNNGGDSGDSNNGILPTSISNGVITFYTSYKTWNVGMPGNANERDVHGTSVSAVIERSTTSKVRLYVNCSEPNNSSNRTEYHFDYNGQISSRQTLTVNIPDGKIIQYVGIQNDNGGAGEVQVSSVTVNGYRETTTGQATCSLKADETTVLVAAPAATGTSDTRVLEYSYNSSVESTYYISGGNVGAIEVTYGLPVPDVSALVPIESDFFWYYNGGEGLGSVGYTNDNHIYRYFPKRANENYAVAASTQPVEVNGATLGDGANHSYVFKQDDAVGFKLKSGVRYRIRVHGFLGNKDGEAYRPTGTWDYLFKQENAAANPTQAANQSGKRTAQGYAGTSNMATYIVDGDDQVYWIRHDFPDSYTFTDGGGNTIRVNSMYFGGFDISPITEINNLNDVTPINATSSWWLDSQGIYTSQANACGDGDGPDIVRPGVKNNAVVVSGPSTALVPSVIEGHHYTALDNNNIVGFKIPAKARIKMHVHLGWTDQSLVMKHTANGSPFFTMNYQTAIADQVEYSGWDHYLYYPSKTGYTSNAEDIWITAGGGASFDFAGFEIEIQEETVDLNAINIINGDYVWRGSENTLPSNGTFGGNYLLNQGLAKDKSDHTHTVDGAEYNTYDFTPVNNRIHLKIAQNLTGEIRVFYRDASATEEEPLGVSQSAMNGSWTPGVATVTNNADNTATVNFAYDTGNSEEVQWPTRGWNMGGTQAYSGVTVNLAETPDRAWQILLAYSDGNVGSDYSSGTSITMAIDPTRNLNAIYIQPQGIRDGETLGYHVASATLITAPNVNGNAATRINDGNNDVAASTTNIEGMTVLSHTFSTAGIGDAYRAYNIYGGKIAGVEVLVNEYVDGSNRSVPTFNAYNLTSVNIASASWCPNETLGRIINNGSTTMVLNGNSYRQAGGNNVAHWIEGGDLVINETTVDNGSSSEADKRSVLLDNKHAVGMRLLGGKRYRLTAYWDNCVSNSIRIYRDPNNPMSGYNRNFNSDNKTEMNAFYTSKPAVFEIDLTDKNDSYTEMIWISGTHDTPVYFSGYLIEMISTAYIKFDTDQPGIFTGKWRAGGDTEDKLLIYCTDNGTQENFVLPRAYYVPVAGSKVELTTTAITLTGNPKEPVSGENGYYVTRKTPNGSTLPKYGGPGSNNNDLGVEAITNSSNEIIRCQVTGLEDTDNDCVYRIVYRYYPSGQSTPVEDYYYVWYANYLKIGWWTTREARLIVDSNKSQDDPDHIIIGDFYVSSGTEGTFYYEFVNPEAGYTYRKETNNGVETWVAVNGKWTYTDDKKQIQGSNRKYDRSLKGIKSNNVDAEEYSWTQMNDHKNHTGYALTVGFPSESDLATYWNNGEVVKEITFEAERPGWPTWSAHVKFHFVRAPQINCKVNNGTNTGTTTITGYAGNYTATPASGTIYYTTDGTSPTVRVDNPLSPGSSMSATNATYVYNGAITSTKSTNFYATEMIYVDKKFYVTNPYTIHIEGADFATMTGTANQSRYFPAMSRLGDVSLIDPMVEYCDASASRVLVRTDQGGATTSSGFAVTGNGGFVYSYPFSNTATYTNGRHMNVLFGDHGKYVYRSSEGNRFKPVGVYWKQDEDNDFSEHLDAAMYKYKTIGENGDGGQNGNPHTECNGGIGGEGTEQGGLFLQPITGDFLRFEPEYDGVITVWIRQNGAGQGNEEKGDITRRPVYVIDENGKVMKRSTVKPSTEHYFGLDGTYGEINSNKATMRQDCRIDWLNGLRNWKSGYDVNDANVPLPLRNMATFRLFNYWYGFPIYQNANAVGHGGSNADKFRWTMDVADSWISRTAKVQSVVCPWNSLVYHSEALHANVEKNEDLTGTGGAQNVLVKDAKGVSRTIYSGDRFALYGYEMPSYGVVRYRFPVKAGKSYYMGGRGTKNGFMAYKFDRLEANYNPANYVYSDNRSINELNYNCETFASVNPTAANATTIENSYYHDGSHGYMADHVQIYSMGGQDNTDETYPNGREGVANSGWKALTNAQLNLDESRGSQQGLTCNVSLWRGFEANKWYTIVLPFSISESRLKEIFGSGVQVLYLDPYDNSMSHDRGSDYKSVANPAVAYNKLRLTYHKYQMLYANVPALICPSQNTGQGYNNGGALEIPRVTIDRSNLGANGYEFKTTNINNKNYQVNGIGYKIGEVGDWEYWITGTYDYVIDGTHPEMYFLHSTVISGEYKTTFYHSDSGVEVQPTRCWIEARPKSGATTNPVPPRLTEITFDNFDFDAPDTDPSGILDIVLDDYKVELYDDGNVYDMLGRKVATGSTEGLPKGVYIFNGEKVYIR